MIEFTGACRAMLAGLARSAPARVFAIEGADAPRSAALLASDPDIRLVSSPRSATILLVLGVLPAELHEAAQRVHDAMPGMRRTIVWQSAKGEGGSEPFVEPVRVFGESPNVAGVLLDAQRSLISGEVAGEPPLLPDEDPNPWRGIGPFGQGGSGMTGGVPYGRPMAETAPDRDGLELDQLSVRAGPFFPAFAPGLALDVVLQGDVIHQLSVAPPPYAARGFGDPNADPWSRALEEPTLVTELEMARARHHLLHVSHVLRVHGLAALSVRSLELVRHLKPGRAEPVIAFAAKLERTRALTFGTAGVGRLTESDVGAPGLGPVARASGKRADERMADATYSALGFEPLLGTDGDARARWRLQLAEAAQSITLAAQAGDRRAGGAGRIESPRGLLTRDTGPTEPRLALLPHLGEGAEWGDFVTCVVSLDIDVRDLPAAGAKGASGQ